MAGHGRAAATRRCCRTWAGTRCPPPAGSALFAGVEAEHPLLLRALLRLRYARAPAATVVGPDHLGHHGEPFAAAVEDGPLAATQFHPEKSGDAGATLLSNWLADNVDDAHPAARRRRGRRPGRAAGPGRGRHRDRLRRPAGGRAGLAARRRRVDPPGRPRRRVRPRLQPRAAGRRGRQARRQRSSCPAASATTPRWPPRWPPAAARVNLGTAALEDPDWVRSAIARHGDRIAVGLDVRGTTLAARGWTREGGDLYETLARLTPTAAPGTWSPT